MIYLEGILADMIAPLKRKKLAQVLIQPRVPETQIQIQCTLQYSSNHVYLKHKYSVHYNTHPTMCTWNTNTVYITILIQPCVPETQIQCTLQYSSNHVYLKQMIQFTLQCFVLCIKGQSNSFLFSFFFKLFCRTHSHVPFRATGISVGFFWLIWLNVKMSL